MASYQKPFLSLPDQLNLIKSRGMNVADDHEAMECLRRNGYYRLSAYWYPFREIVAAIRTDTFLPNSHFEDAINLYKFDKALKLHLLDAIERVEIAARVQIAITLGERDRFAHENPREFHTRFTTPDPLRGTSDYEEWHRKFKTQVDGSKDEFILHYQAQYGSRHPLPIWIAIELWDFGLLSRAFSGMKYQDQVDVATRFSVPNWVLLESWLRSLNYIRNVIAHHGRLWNLNLSQHPRLPRRGQISDFDALVPFATSRPRIYVICCILCYLTSVINPQSPWVKDLKDLVQRFPKMPHAGIRDMGFPSNWESHGFWT